MGEGSGFPTLLDDIKVMDMNPYTALNLFLPMEVLVSKTETPPKRGLDENPNIQIERGRKDHTKCKPNLRQNEF